MFQSRVRNAFTAILLLVGLSLCANDRHPKGPDTKPSTLHRLRIEGGEKEFLFSFSAPDGNDSEIPDTLLTVARVDDPRFDPDRPGGPVQIRWSWGRNWFWQDYDGFLTMIVRIMPWQHAGQVDRVDGLNILLTQLIEASRKSDRAKDSNPGSVAYGFLGDPTRIEIHSRTWLRYDTARLPSLSGLKNPSFAAPLDDRHYLVVRFGFIDQSGIAPGSSSDWKSRAIAMIEKITSSLELGPVKAEPPAASSK